MHESEFHILADATLEQLLGALEPADASGALEVEDTPGVLTITLNNGKQYVVSKHTPSRQIWLSSPISGGLHFSYRDTAWKLADERTLTGILSQELGMAL